MSSWGRHPRPLTPYGHANPRISFRLPADQKARLDKLKAENGTTYPLLILEALDLLEGRARETQVNLADVKKRGEAKGFARGKGRFDIR